jgi:prophage regulatory protein
MSHGAHINDDTKHRSINRLPVVLARLGVSKTILYDTIKKGLFPAPVKLMADSRSVGWFEEDVDDYINALKVHQSGSPETQVAEPAKESDISAPLRTFRSPAKQTKNSISYRGKPAAAFDDALVATGLEIMGRPVFLHKKSGRFLLDIGHMPLQLVGNFDSTMATDSG